jgi:hypothetical protein
MKYSIFCQKKDIWLDSQSFIQSMRLILIIFCCYHMAYPFTTKFLFIFLMSNKLNKAFPRIYLSLLWIEHFPLWTIQNYKAFWKERKNTLPFDYLVVKGAVWRQFRKPDIFPTTIISFSSRHKSGSDLSKVILCLVTPSFEQNNLVLRAKQHNQSAIAVIILNI